MTPGQSGDPKKKHLWESVLPHLRPTRSSAMLRKFRTDWARFFGGGGATGGGPLEGGFHGEVGFKGPNNGCEDSWKGIFYEAKLRSWKYRFTLNSPK